MTDRMSGLRGLQDYSDPVLEPASADDSTAVVAPVTL
jgi:hypothetical protein